MMCICDPVNNAWDSECPQHGRPTPPRRSVSGTNSSGRCSLAALEEL